MIYFPSIDAAASGMCLHNDSKFLDKFGFSPKFWKDWPEEYLHKYYLVSAGVRYKNIDYVKKFDFPSDMQVFGDSGGYQITSGVLTWENSLRKSIFDWLEVNSTIAANLDLPPRGRMEGKFLECLDISFENFKYFHERQSGHTQYLNCLQGTNYQSYSEWYEKMKGFEFSGWAIGAASWPERYIGALTLLLKNKELHKDSCKYVHFFGVSTIAEIAIFNYIERLFRDNGINVAITIDSSSPSLSSSYGYWYVGYELRPERFKYIHIPRFKDNPTIYDGKHQIVPKLNKIDELMLRKTSLFDVYTDYTGIDYAAIAFHNLSVFIDTMKSIGELMDSEWYTLEQLLSKNVQSVIKSFERIFYSDNPEKEYYRNLDLYRTIKMPKSEFNDNLQDFF
jgi:hypothetical protein